VGPRQSRNKDPFRTAWEKVKKSAEKFKKEDDTRHFATRGLPKKRTVLGRAKKSKEKNKGHCLGAPADSFRKMVK